jgi:HlyD family secretion protein
VPIIALTVRDSEADEEHAEGEPADVEGVFLVADGAVSFRPVGVGIAGQEFFEVLSGLSAGDTVVAGPYQRIRQLRDGDLIRVNEDDAPDPGDEG